jgi:hypothetical protein
VADIIPFPRKRPTRPSLRRPRRPSQEVPFDLSEAIIASLTEALVQEYRRRHPERFPARIAELGHTGVALHTHSGGQDGTDPQDVEAPDRDAG